MSLPVIRGVSALNWPFTMTLKFLTGVGQWQNGAQQRWIRLPSALVKFTVPYPALTQAQKNTVRAAITSAKGRFDNTLSISGPFGSGLATYFNLSIDDDEWIATEAVTTQYNGPLKLSQTITQSLSPGTAGQPFPTLANGSMGILPYKQKKRFQTVQTAMEQGPNYSYAEFGGGLTGYPLDGLMAWSFQEDLLTDIDTATRIAHFVANFGKAYSFAFRDEPSGSAISTGINNSTTAIPFAVDPGWVIGQVFQIDSEQLIVTAGYSGGNVTATRGYNSTSAASHLSGAMTYCVYLTTHYASDVLTINFKGVNNSSINIDLEATF